MITANAKLKHATIRAVKTHADGRVEDLGIVAYHSDNPIKRMLWKFSRVPVIGKAIRPYFR